MSILKPKSLQEMIISLLQDGEKTTGQVLSEIKGLKNKVTKQGFYAALRKLKAEEIVVIYKRTIALNTSWVREMRHIFEQIEEIQATENKSVNLFSLEEKESVSYSFSTINHLDVFWGHSQNLLIEKTPRSEPVYAYDPHYWFYIARKETERKLLNSITQNHRQFLMTVGYSTELDKSIKSDFNNDYLQYNIRPLFQNKNYYVTVIGDYITEVCLDQKTENKINHLYHKNSSVNSKLMEEFKELLTAKAKNKIKITRNRVKAEKLKSKLRKDFYIMQSSMSD